MAVVDKRDKSEVYEGGSSRIAIFITDAQIAAALGDPSATTGGWIQPSYQESTQVGPSRDSEAIKDEADNLIKNRIGRDEFVIITTFFQTDDEVINLLTWMEDAENGVPIRYPMPTDDPTLPDQWVFLYNANVLPEDWRIEAANAADRTRAVTFVGSKDSDGDIYAMVSLPTAQNTSEWSPYTEFKDDRATS